MGFLDRLLGRGGGDDEEVPIALDVEQRRRQLQRLETALDTLATEMREAQSVNNPGWRARINEYSRLAGEAMTIRRTGPTREQILDLVFEVRPAFTGPVPPGLEGLVPFQDEVLAAAEELRELLPHERP